MTGDTPDANQAVTQGGKESAQATLEPGWQSIKAELKVGSRVCECTSCGAFFSGVKTFDHHRYGPWEHRHCRTPKQMLAVGLVQNQHKVWFGSNYKNPEGKKKKRKG